MTNECQRSYYSDVSIIEANMTWRSEPLLSCHYRLVKKQYNYKNVYDIQQTKHKAISNIYSRWSGGGYPWFGMQNITRASY